MTVENVSLTKDLGEYRCVAYCIRERTTFNATFNVTNILNGSSFTFTKTEQFDHIEPSTNKSSETILVKYLGYPPPKLEWFDKNEKRINWTFKEDITRKFEAFVNLNRKWTTLKIRNATITDSGNYTLSVQSGHVIKNKTIELLIAGIQ